MPARDLSPVVEFETATVQRIFLVLMVIFFGMAILGIVGEILGWWNDIGEVLTIVGTIGGLFVGAATMSTGASEKHLNEVQAAVLDNGTQLKKNGTQLEENGATLGTIDGKLDKLDKVQVELDRQTGVLDEQLSVLTEVRDRL